MTGLVVAIAVVFAVVFVYVIARMGAKAGRERGYARMGGDTIVRCSRGHLFTTKWIVGSSVKAVRLGGYKRYQRCPVCTKWRIVVPVPEDELTDEDRGVAAEHHDTRLP
jgi:tricorn protease-like protein